jgi:hypothetical protein
VVAPVRFRRGDERRVFAIDLPPAVQQVKGFAKAKEVLRQRNALDAARARLRTDDASASPAAAVRLQVNVERRTCAVT